MFTIYRQSREFVSAKNADNAYDAALLLSLADGNKYTIVKDNRPIAVYENGKQTWNINRGMNRYNGCY